MISVFLSHSSKDKPFVRELADFLGRDDEFAVWLDEKEIAPGDNIVGRIGDGLNADFILLILSPDSVESNWVKEEWTDAFWEQTINRKTKLVGILLRNCEMPPLLRDKKHLDLRTNQTEGFREIRTYLLTQKPVPPRRVNQLPDRPPIFVGREAQLNDLRARLAQPGAVVPVCEMAGRGKTALALEFAHRYQYDFEAVYWLACHSQSLAAMAAELMRQLDLKLDYDLPGIIAELKRACSQKRCLLILDNVDDESPGQLIAGGASSVLITTRHSDLKFLKLRKKADLPLLTDDQCFAIFRQVLGDEEVDRSKTECRVLFQRLGYLAQGIVVCVGLLQDVHYTISGMSKNPPQDVYALILEAIQALDPNPKRLLAAMSSCAAEGLRLDLAAMIADFDEPQSLDALQPLVSRNLVEEVSRSDRRYRLHSMVRSSAGGEEFAAKHAEAVSIRFEAWESNWRRCAEEMPEFQLALKWCLEGANGPRDLSTADSLADYAFPFALRVGRMAEAFEICERMTKASLAEDRRGAWVGNEALILRIWGRLEKALALLKRQETICEELGNRYGLQASYGNQALILKAWGRLEEALALHKKQEAICEELGNRDGLQRSYGNQAVILQYWGRREEALALLKRQETICEELGNRDSLQISYGNQALILKAWGRLEEALALHKKQEAICEELGNRDSLQRSYGNRAFILQAWGRLEEALALLEKQEAICEELGNRASLGICYANWGLLDRQMGNPAAAREKLAKALTIFQQLNMPRELAAVQADLDLPQTAAAT